MITILATIFHNEKVIHLSPRPFSFMNKNIFPRINDPISQCHISTVNLHQRCVEQHNKRAQYFRSGVAKKCVKFKFTLISSVTLSYTLWNFSDSRAAYKGKGWTPSRMEKNLCGHIIYMFYAHVSCFFSEPSLPNKEPQGTNISIHIICKYCKYCYVSTMLLMLINIVEYVIYVLIG